ncbi:hypothetical protein Pla163_27680 [Planctomycetes bacterium Pla163]|uniref:FG-GAP repeat protein n=1 Tax=Rohdeia mirabilis TaxID=2528008 RepID=A0A518D2D4_9BACT|nr:hypothetical protein Pla163_27680 [Planctomycetes bacterium Pla163]
MLRNVPTSSDARSTPVRLLTAGVFALTVAGHAHAQFQHPTPLPEVLLVNDAFGSSTGTTSLDLYEDQIFRLADFDGDGLFESVLETSLLFEFGKSPNKNKSWGIEAVRSRMENGVPVVYFTNGRNPEASGSSKVAELWRGSDVDGDAFIDESELTLVGDLKAILGGDQTMQGLAVCSSGSVWAATDFGGGGLVRFFNGSATVLVDDDDGPFKVPGKFGSPVNIDTDDFTKMTTYGDDGVLVYSDGYQSAKDEAVHRFQDLNGDGDILDPNEAVCFFNATGANTALLRNPDFGTTLPSMVVNSSQNGYCWLKEMATMTEPLGGDTGGTQESYFFASTSSNTSAFGINQAGQFVNGLVFRAVDKNLNGHVNDTGEVNLYYDGSGDAGSAEQLDKILGIDTYEQSLILFYLRGGGKAVILLTDLNGDGDAMDAGERLDVWDENNSSDQPWNLFFFGIAAAAFEPGILPEPTSRQATLSGTGCAQFGGRVPRMSAQGESRIGSPFCQLQVFDAPPNSFTWLFLGATNTFFGQPLPVDLGVVGLPGCTLYQDLAFNWIQPTNADGFAKLEISPALQFGELAGSILHFQAVTADGLGVTNVPEIGLTQLLTLEILGPSN